MQYHMQQWSLQLKNENMIMDPESLYQVTLHPVHFPHQKPDSFLKAFLLKLTHIHSHTHSCSELASHHVIVFLSLVMHVLIAHSNSYVNHCSVSRWDMYDMPFLCCALGPFYTPVMFKCVSLFNEIYCRGPNWYKMSCSKPLIVLSAVAFVTV